MRRRGRSGSRRASETEDIARALQFANFGEYGINSGGAQRLNAARAWNDCGEHQENASNMR